MKKFVQYAVTIFCFNSLICLQAQHTQNPKSQSEESLDKKIDVIRSDDVEPTEIFDDEMGTDAEGYRKNQSDKGIGGIPLAPSSY